MKTIICVGIDRYKLLNSSVVTVAEVEDDFKFTKEWLVQHQLKCDKELDPADLEASLANSDVWHISETMITQDEEEFGNIWSLV
jgi:hypothetical protein